MIRAIGERILMEIVEISPSSDGILRVMENKQYQVGKVVCIGEKCSTVAVGEYVWSRVYSGLVLSYGGKDYVSLAYSDIIGVSSELI